MSEHTDIIMDKSEDTANESHFEIQGNGVDMQEPSTSEYQDVMDDEEQILEPDPGEVLIEETLDNESQTLNEILKETVSIEDTTENKSKQNTRLPLARIKQIMKFDPDCSIISRDCLVLVSKATEMFIEFLGKEAVKHTLSNKKKTISKKDVEAAIDCAPNLYFLDGALEWE